MGAFGGTEIIIIIAVLVLFFGAKKIPELARGIGEGMTEFKKATNDQINGDNEDENTVHSDSSKKEKKHSE
jgi:sec-independent protein translocase protein TatA